MRRLFIMRKDLHMSPGKLAAQVAHCAEAYWTRQIRLNAKKFAKGYTMVNGESLKPYGIYYRTSFDIPTDEYEEYINGIFTKTICEAKNKSQLMKAATKAEELGLELDVDYGIIADACLTEFEPEEPDGTTITGIWFKPLPDDVAHEISKKYQLYR